MVVLVSESWTSLESLSIPTLRQLYLGRRSRIAGKPVDLFDLRSGDAVRKGFGRSVLRMSGRELRRYWVEQALTGGALPPREVRQWDAQRISEQTGSLARLLEFSAVEAALPLASLHESRMVREVAEAYATALRALIARRS